MGAVSLRRSRQLRSVFEGGRLAASTGRIGMETISAGHPRTLPGDQPRTLAALPTSLLELVGRLNQYVCAQNPSGRRFTTAMLAELEPATGGHTTLSAGGLPLIFTDGLVEAEDGKELEYGEPRMLENINSVSIRPPRMCSGALWHPWVCRFNASARRQHLHGRANLQCGSDLR
jgi:hypothetical protein